MSIIWQIGDKIVVSDANLQSLSATARISKSTKQALQGLSGHSLQILDIGTVDTVINIMFYVRVIPLIRETGATNPKHTNFNSGIGVSLYFETEDDLNNIFANACAALPRSTAILAMNAATIPLPKYSMVRQVGIDPTTRVVRVDLASASSLLTSSVLGMLLETVEPEAVGRLLIQGQSPPINTLGSSFGAPLWLSDLPGGYRTTPGTIGVVVGTILNVGIGGTAFIGSGGFFPVLFS